MSTGPRVAVTSRSFSRHPELRAELLARYPDAVFNDAGLSLKGEALVAFLDGCERAVIALETVDDALLSRLPGLRVIGKYGVGLNNLDLHAMRRHGVKLGWQGGVNRRSVAEETLAMAIILLRGLHISHDEVRRGAWRQIVGRQLTGKTVGVIGVGHVGKDLVQLLAPFSCRVLAHDIRPDEAFCARHGVTMAGLDDLLAEADVVTLHVPLDADTLGMIGERELGLMQTDAVLINAARGGIVDEAALLQALKAGRPTAAALDVFAEEPPRGNPLLDLPNVFAVAHLGGSAAEAILAMGRAAIAGLDEAYDVNPDALA